MRLNLLTVMTFSTLIGLGACEKEAAPPAAQQAAEQIPAAAAPAPVQPVESVPPATATAPGSGSNLIREPIAAAQEQPMQAIQTKMGPKGSTMHLMSAKVTGQILTVEFVMVPPKKEAGSGYDSITVRSPLKSASYIDDSTAKKVAVLQDDSGAYMASPLNSDGSQIMMSGNRPVPASLKFPAPPESSPTVSVNLADIGSFDGVPVSR